MGLRVRRLNTAKWKLIDKRRTKGYRHRCSAGLPMLLGVLVTIFCPKSTKHVTVRREDDGLMELLWPLNVRL
jgi:hypothetical protein